MKISKRLQELVNSRTIEGKDYRTAAELLVEDFIPNELSFDGLTEKEQHFLELCVTIIDKKDFSKVPDLCIAARESIDERTNGGASIKPVGTWWKKDIYKEAVQMLEQFSKNTTEMGSAKEYESARLSLNDICLKIKEMYPHVRYSHLYGFLNEKTIKDLPYDPKLRIDRKSMEKGEFRIPTREKTRPARILQGYAGLVLVLFISIITRHIDGFPKGKRTEFGHSFRAHVGKPQNFGTPEENLRALLIALLETIPKLEVDSKALVK